VLKDDLKWLKRRFAMLEDILRDTPVYQEVLADLLLSDMCRIACQLLDPHSGR
jgi:hypothetical protein